MIPFFDLPDEVIQHILSHLPPVSVASFQNSSRECNLIVKPLLWRNYCQRLYRYWNSRHNIEEKLTGPINAVDWKALFVKRYEIDRYTIKMINSIVSSQSGRIAKIHSIAQHEYDAKDILLWQMNHDNGAGDILARKYYSRAVLGCIHRKMALQEWSRLAAGQCASIENALVAFDMFVLHDREGDFDDITSRLDRIAHRICYKYPGWHQYSPRQKAITTADYLRTHDPNAAAEETWLSDLQDNFLGIALVSSSPSLLPTVSAAIYCSLARRLSFDARPLCLPFNVVVVVQAAQGFDLDGEMLAADSPARHRMFIDLSQSSSEISFKILSPQLLAIGIPTPAHIKLSKAASIVEVVVRSGHNVLTCVRNARRNSSLEHNYETTNSATLGSISSDLECACYGALWALILLSPSSGRQAGSLLSHVVEQCETRFPMDVPFLEQYIVPLFKSHFEFTQLCEIINLMGSNDSAPRNTKIRTREISQRVLYKIGQVFQHRRYGYHGVIIGWDSECQTADRWTADMDQSDILRGSHQSFYEVLVEDKTLRYVAENSIRIIKPDNPSNLMMFAGQYFKRWDPEKHVFVNNMLAEYPND